VATCSPDYKKSIIKINGFFCYPLLSEDTEEIQKNKNSAVCTYFCMTWEKTGAPGKTNSHEGCLSCQRKSIITMWLSYISGLDIEREHKKSTTLFDENIWQISHLSVFSLVFSIFARDEDARLWSAMDGIHLVAMSRWNTNKGFYWRWEWLYSPSLLWAKHKSFSFVLMSSLFELFLTQHTLWAPSRLR